MEDETPGVWTAIVWDRNLGQSRLAHVRAPSATVAQIEAVDSYIETFVEDYLRHVYRTQEYASVNWLFEGRLDDCRPGRGNDDR